MNGKNIPKIVPKKRILIAPLDWGLGHATRCIPIIHFLLKQHIDVFIAGESRVISLLKPEFPHITYLKLRGYGVKYSKKKAFFTLNMLLQIPKILRSIRSENRWLHQTIAQHRIDAVISDNRYGLYSKKIPCVFITHQLCIQTGHELVNKILQKINYRLINNFEECWVPDLPGKKNLAGDLSHPELLPKIPVKYIGLLSRFKKSELAKKEDLLILISGPEPQRSIFEKLILKQLPEGISVVLVRGLPEKTDNPIPGNKWLKVFDHLTATELNKLILGTNMVVARCGYSTIMDLVMLNKNAILVPTPGQKEQEYLAGYLHENKIFYCTPQESFSLKTALNSVKDFSFSTYSADGSMHENETREWLEKNKL